MNLSSTRLDLSQARAQTRVIKLSSKSNRNPQRTKSNRCVHLVAVAVLGVALVLFGLILSHSTSGMAIVTGASLSDGWAMAIGIDLGFIVRGTP